MVGKEPQQRLVVENVTLLPPGREWLVLALRCIGHADARLGQIELDDAWSLGAFYGLDTLSALEKEELAPLRAAQLRLFLARSMMLPGSTTFVMSNDLHSVVGSFVTTQVVLRELQFRGMAASARADAVAEILSSGCGIMQRNDAMWAELLSLLGPYCGLEVTDTTPIDVNSAVADTDDGDGDGDDETLAAQFLIGVLASSPGGRIERGALRRAFEKQGFSASLLKCRWLEHVAGVFVTGSCISLTKNEAASPRHMPAELVRLRDNPQVSNEALFTAEQALQQSVAIAPLAESGTCAECGRTDAKAGNWDASDGNWYCGRCWYVFDPQAARAYLDARIQSACKKKQASAALKVLADGPVAKPLALSANGDSQRARLPWIPSTLDARSTIPVPENPAAATAAVAVAATDKSGALTASAIVLDMTKAPVLTTDEITMREQVSTHLQFGQCTARRIGPYRGQYGV